MLSKSSNFKTATNLLEEANQLKQSGQLQAAIIAYRQAGQLNPKFHWIYHNLGEALAENNQLLEAIQAFQRAIELNPDSPWSQYQLAEILLKLGNLPQAINALNCAITLNPNVTEFYNSLGKALFKQAELDQAISYYQKALELNSEDAIAYQYLGEALAQRGQLDEAIDSCRKAIDLNPNLGDAYEILGKALVKKGLFDQALSILLEALEFNPKSPETYHALGDVYVYFKQWHQAIEAYSQAIQLKPNTAIFYHGLGNVFAQLNQWEEAVSAYSQAIVLNPESAECHQNFAEVLAKLERWDAAIASYSKALELNPNLTDIYSRLADALKNRGTPGDLQKANQYYQKTIELNGDDIDAYQTLLKYQPDNLDLCWKYANLLWSKNQREQALIYYKKVKDGAPQDFEMLVKLGEAFVRMSEFEDAIAIYNKALEINPNSSDVYHRLGEPLEKTGQLEAAVKTYEKAIELNPNFFGSYHNLGDIQQRQKKFEQAISAYKKAIELNSGFHWSYHNLADTLEKQGNAEEAIATYRKCLEINPHFGWSHCNLATALAKQGKIEDALHHYRRASELDPALGIDFNGLKTALLDQILVEDYMYKLWRDKNFPRASDLIKMAETIELFRYKPVFSVIMPVYNTPEEFLREAIESVINQIYPYWEFCIADDASPSPHVKEVLEEYQAKDSRIKVIYRTKNGHISASSNSALELATGEFITLLDHDDLITPDGLYEVALLLNRNPDLDMIYSDEDKISPNGNLINPYFKPEWCPESFLSRMYTCHLGTYRRSIIEEIGGFRIGYEGAQDYDLVLRFTEKTQKIAHIPKVLYHWRMHSGSTAGGTEAKPYAYEASEKAIQDAVDRRRETGIVTGVPGFLGHHLVRYKIMDYKKVSIIIPTRDLGEVLDRCLQSIFTQTIYPNYEVIVIDNGSVQDYTFKVFSKWNSQEPSRFKCYRLDIPFNFSTINNYGVSQATGDYLLFLNNDTEVIHPDWMNAMVEQVQRPQIGAVGVLLLFPDNTIQHAGVVMGLGGVAGHGYYAMSSDIPGYFGNVVGFNNVSAVTGACLMCRREVFEQIGGFDEQLTVAYNDVDLCLKMLDQGYRNLYLPHVKLYHHESKSRGYEDTPEKKERLNRESKIIEGRWQKYIDNDPCYSPHLTRICQNFSIKV
ncbi:tetratricopeptide repeat protein [Planktothrix sp. FACHB-1365]|uniref:tetratricopeptide repeat protein n=1 Tax=Planktothrix sp. FACHB-1365 TaxID=2692855 RepID=UPI001682A94E|nr:tetratricopeptide repeat protein [Planktothrix sp. FACHB-1365]MBD2484162.1 tetratricopeptide repeat protein [Planktothrix sp. FACHB-1365]